MSTTWWYSQCQFYTIDSRAHGDRDEFVSQRHHRHLRGQAKEDEDRGGGRGGGFRGGRGRGGRGSYHFRGRGLY